MEPISRRAFLAGSMAVVLTACSGDDDAGPPDPTATTGASTSPPSSAPPSPPSTAPATTTTTVAGYAGTEPPFTLGVASGDPLADSVVLWTRLAPAADGAAAALPDQVGVRVEVARDAAFADPVSTIAAVAVAADGHALHVVAEGLEPDSWYWYRFVTGAHTSAAGRTRTTPLDAAGPGPLVFGSACCQNYQDGFYTAHRDIAGGGLDFLVWLGDYIYGVAGQAVGENRRVRTHGAGEPTTVAQYRERYALYKRDPDLQAAHAACPWLVIWDDHEVQNNYAGDVSADTGVTPAAFRARRAAAYQAWWEHMPVRLERPAGADYRIYRSFRFGELVELSLLDTRQFRSDQACGDVTLDLDPACAETFEPARTMLGAEQEAWLDHRLAAAAGRWNVLAQQVILGDTTVNGAVLNYDQWDGYPAARDRLLAAVAERAVPNLVVLTGDIHFAGVGNLRVPGGGPLIGSEMVATSISSGGLVNPALQPLVVSIPDIVDAELAHRGWIKHTVTAQRWEAEYRIVDDVKVPDAAVGVYATYAIQAGSPGAAKV